MPIVAAASFTLDKSELAAFIKSQGWTQRGARLISRNKDRSEKQLVLGTVGAALGLAVGVSVGFHIPVVSKIMAEVLRRVDRVFGSVPVSVASFSHSCGGGFMGFVAVDQPSTQKAIIESIEIGNRTVDELLAFLSAYSDERHIASIYADDGSIWPKINQSEPIFYAARYWMLLQSGLITSPPARYGSEAALEDAVANYMNHHVAQRRWAISSGRELREMCFDAYRAVAAP